MLAVVAHVVGWQAEQGQERAHKALPVGVWAEHLAAGSRSCRWRGGWGGANGLTAGGPVPQRGPGLDFIGD